MAVKPISPAEIQSVKDTTIPDEIIEATNALIVKKWNGCDATVKQDDIISEAIKRFAENGKDISRQKVFEYRWMDIESTFRNAGWTVEYDKPALGETYPATFTFSRTRRRGKRGY